MVSLNSPKAGRQALLDAFIDLVEAKRAAFNDVCSAALYLACIVGHDKMNLARDVFLNMCGAFWDDTVKQREVKRGDARSRLLEVLDRVRN